MKKLLLIFAMIIGIATATQAKDEYVHDSSVLPKAAISTIDNNFKAKVSLVKIEKDWGRITEYEVILTDGTEISFDRQGNWDNIEVNRDKAVPNSLVPQAIRDNVARMQPGQKIIGIDKERRGYDIELTNGIEMKFDTAGNFLRYDD